MRRLFCCLLASGFGSLVVTACSPGHAESENTSMTKPYRLSADQIRPLATGRGGAIASDRITVDGRLVGYMYRTTPRSSQDSGWAFLAGDESEEYMGNPKNHNIYDVNTIANYDPQIIPLLDAPIGSAYIRTASGLVHDPQGAPEE
ncbi:MAG TPA: DUF2185 domain-containing protein [Sphingomonas sp.]|nr:DUF2185 domain-containing protein [Sphingomonas sp.]